MSASPSQSPQPSGPVNKHAATPVDRQRAQLEKLLKDPSKPAYVPAAPKEKGVRPPREMMKNVQGSSAGAGSGEFHVYKASRRREYERLKLMDEQALKEVEEREFERKRQGWEEQANAKTEKNRAKRMKKKGRAKGKETDKEAAGPSSGKPDAPIKKRRLVNGKELVFKRPGEEGSDGESEEGPSPLDETARIGGTGEDTPEPLALPVVDAPRIIIHEDN